MANFNTNSIGTRTTNEVGGIAYKESPELELISILFTSLGKDNFYEKSQDRYDRLAQVLKTVDPWFAAKAALYTRRKLGLRTITHVLASQIAPFLKGRPDAYRFYEKIIDRPDDLTEIFSYHTSHSLQPELPTEQSKMNKLNSAMKKGLRASFAKFDTYQLAKYKSEGKKVRLLDLVRILHPYPTERNSDGLKKLVEGTLKATGTSNAEMSAIGQKKMLSQDERDKLIKDSWATRIKQRKIGYFDLLRNLRNISEQAPASIVDACYMLVDHHLIKKSRILPIQFMKAHTEIMKLRSSESRAITIAINQAIDIAFENTPKFDGRTLVVLDISGSMTSAIGEEGSPAQIGSLFAATLAKANQCDLLFFAERAAYVEYNPLDTVTTLAQAVLKHAGIGGGTDFSCIFTSINKSYDRIIILSDMQGWLRDYKLKPALQEYKKNFKTDPKIYSFDLTGNGTLQFPERNIYCIAGISEKVFEIMRLLDHDREALIKFINSIEI